MTALLLSSAAALLALLAVLILARNKLVLSTELKAIRIVYAQPNALELAPLLDEVSYQRKMLQMHNWTFHQFYPTLKGLG